MSLPFAQPESGLMPSDDLKELMPLPEVLGGTAFVSTRGRAYRLFGNEERTFSMPMIPEVPPILAATKSSPLSLEEALQQIETFSSPKTNCSVSEAFEQPKPNFTVRTVEPVSVPAHPPTLQLFQALGEPAIPDQNADLGFPLKLVKNENVSPNATQNVTLSVKDVVREVSQVFPGVASNSLPKPKKEGRSSLRLVSDHVEEPFIVPFAKAEPPPEKHETKNTVLRIVTMEFIPPILSSRVLKKYGQHRRKVRTLYRKRFSLPLVSESQPVELPVVSIPKPPVDISTFQWSAQLDSLMLTASNQIRTLTDHLVVQQHQGIKAICFKSVFSGDGCSTILLCATRALIERNYRILLIDTHHRHIDLPNQLNLSGNLDTGNEVITINDRLGLWVWQESKTTEENTALIAEIVAAHREEYDLILLDDGSVTESPLTAFVEFWKRVELNGIVLVSNTKRPTEMPISHIARRLRQHHVSLIGIAENYV